jgi:D-glycero-alpha-D-manno-heptose 1-phosphate guanylyltransferase
MFEDNISEAIILVGGKGTRLKSILTDRPKPMAIVAGKPFVEWIVLLLQRQGIQRIVMCTGHLSEVVEAYFADRHNFGVEITFSKDPFPLGTGGAIRHSLKQTVSEHLLVLNGDSYRYFDCSKLLTLHRKKNARASMCLTQVEDCSRFGSVRIDENNMILEFVEKDQTSARGLVNSGIYLFEREIIERFPKDKKFSLEHELFPQLIGKGLYGFLFSGDFIDIGTPESFVISEDFLKNELSAQTKGSNDK